MVGESNETEIIVQGEQMTALLDSGSMISTLSEDRYDRLNSKPELKQLTDLGLDISVTDGSCLKYKGYIECTIRVQDMDLVVPMLIVPSTEYNKICPVIVGTNIIRVCRDYFQKLSQTDQLPYAWQVAIGQSCRSFCV
jgi:hypothetical protein